MKHYDYEPSLEEDSAPEDTGIELPLDEVGEEEVKEFATPEKGTQLRAHIDSQNLDHPPGSVRIKHLGPEIRPFLENMLQGEGEAIAKQPMEFPSIRVLEDAEIGNDLSVTRDISSGRNLSVNNNLLVSDNVSLSNSGVKIEEWDGATWVDVFAVDADGNISTSGKGVMPIGATYIQLPGESDPSVLFTGTWENISTNFPGDFFRVEGGDAVAYDGAEQLDQMQLIEGRFGSGVDTRGIAAELQGVFTDSGVNTYNMYADSGWHTHRRYADFSSANSPNSRTSLDTDGETRPVNKTIRIWERIA